MTPTMKETLEAINRYYELNGVAPTIRELGKLRGIRGIRAIHNQVQELIARGYLTRLPGRDRNMAPVDLLARWSTDELREEIARREARNDCE